MITNPTNPEEIMAEVARRLGRLNDKVVFVGGIVTALLITRKPTPQPRVTKDVDLVVPASTAAAYWRFEEDLRQIGFAHDKSEGAPNCRWTVGNVIVDTMPENPKALGFDNQWYPEV